MVDGGTAGSGEEDRIAELERLVRQLEGTAREAHAHLRDEIAETEGTIDAQAEQSDEL
jgi:hypothetical protein